MVQLIIMMKKSVERSSPDVSVITSCEAGRSKQAKLIHKRTHSFTLLVVSAAQTEHWRDHRLALILGLQNNQNNIKGETIDGMTFYNFSWWLKYNSTSRPLGPGDTLSVLGSRRGSQGLLLALCDFSSRGAVSTGSGEGSKLEGRPGTPLLVYLGSSQSEAYSSNCRPLSRCWGLSPGAAAANGCLSSCNMNTAATADCLQLPPKVCAVETDSQWLGGRDLGSESTQPAPPTCRIPDPEPHLLLLSLSLSLVKLLGWGHAYQEAKGTLPPLGSFTTSHKTHIITSCSFTSWTYFYCHYARCWAYGGEQDKDDPLTG